jgi:protein TonB
VALRQCYKRNVVRGFVAAVVLHVAGLGTYWVLEATEEPPPPPQQFLVTYTELAPPPSITEPPPPPDAPPAGGGADVSVATGIPEAVPDEEADPEQTIASQEELSAMGSGIGESVGVLGGTGTGRVLQAPPPPPPPPPPPVEEPAPEPEVFESVSRMPELIGGLAAIRPVYPEMERAAGLEGRVILQFIVHEDGTISDLVVVQGASPGFDAAALAAMERVRFVPGQQNGHPVKVRMMVPIRFRLRS